MISQEIKAALFNRRTLTCVFTGFASGLPLYILIQLVPYWLRKEGIGLAEIGFFTLIGLPYTWKFIWSPLLERFQPKWLGRRRGWMIISQITLLISVSCLGFLNPQTQLWTIAILCTLIAFLSATQDIVLDAYRREILPDKELGIGNSVHVNAYRIAGLIPGGMSLVLADHLPWETVFLITAAFMVIAVGMTITISEPKHATPPPPTLKQAVVEPFREFFQRNGIRQALLVLTFMLLYKLGDSMATALQTPFFQDIGFSGTEIGVIAKNASLWPVIIGGLD